VKERVTAVGDEEVPERVSRSIFNAARYGRRGNFLQALLLNPFLLALAVAVVVVLLFFLVGSEVFREP
jgi:hypothetical protein